MGPREFARWQLFYEREPWGYPIREWWWANAGMVTAVFSGRAKKSLKYEHFTRPKPRARVGMTASEICARLGVPWRRGKSTPKSSK